MKKLILIIVLIFPLIVSADNSENGDMSEVIDMMVVAKATGMCGVFAQMLNFQSATKMPGGDEFILRFLSTEAARLGMTVEELTGQCPSTVKQYNLTMKLLGFEQ